MRGPRLFDQLNMKLMSWSDTMNSRRFKLQFNYINDLQAAR